MPSPSPTRQPESGRTSSVKRTGSRIVKSAPPPARSTRSEAAKAPARSLCPVNLTLELVGDNWTMLIIRDMMLRGHKGYQAFLKSGEGIATNILSDRLAKLEQNGLVSKSSDPSDARRFIYSLTEKGADLAPILVELALYGARYEPRADIPKDVLQDMQRNRQTFGARLAKSHTPRVKSKPSSKTPRAQADETLSLFD